MRFKKEKLPLNSKALSNEKTKEKLKIKRDLLIKKTILARKEYEDQALVSLKDENYFKKLHNLDVKVKKLSKRLEIIDRKIENSNQVKKNFFSNLKTWLLDYKYINQHIPRYATSYEKDAIKEELELKKLRLKRNLQNVNREYIKAGRLASTKPWRRRRVFTFSKMMKDLKKQINGIGIDLQRLETGNYEILSFFRKIKKFFASLSYQQQKAIFGILFVLPWLVGFIIFFAYPMFTTFWWSLNNMEAQLGGGYLMKFVGFGNFKALFTSKTLSGVTMAELLTSSLLSIVLDIPTIIIFSLFVAILLNTKFKGYQIARLIFFIPVVYNLAVINNTLTGHFGQMFGSELSNRVVLSDQFSNFIRQIGIGGGLIDFLVDAVNRIFSIVNRSGIQIIIFLAALQSIPKHLYEAANIEGATKYEMFWKITIPMVSPMILTAIIFTIVESFATTEIMHYMTVNSQGTKMSTNQPGLFSAISIIYFIANAVLILIIFLLMRKRVFYYDK